LNISALSLSTDAIVKLSQRIAGIGLCDKSSPSPFATKATGLSKILKVGYPLTNDQYQTNREIRQTQDLAPQRIELGPAQLPTP